MASCDHSQPIGKCRELCYRKKGGLGAVEKLPLGRSYSPGRKTPLLNEVKTQGKQVVINISDLAPLVSLSHTVLLVTNSNQYSDLYEIVHGG
jgi:hypothetical protein